MTGAMLESGFNTKSNFNREFQRVTGRSPTAWLAEAAGSSADPVASAAPMERDRPEPSAHRLVHPR